MARNAQKLNGMRDHLIRRVFIILKEVTMEKNDKLYAMRHSMAHILATALKSIYKDISFGVGPVVENGFYYDVVLDNGKTISDEDFPAIEKEMHKIIKSDSPFKKSHKDIDEAIEWAKDNNQKFKVELLNDLKREGTTEFKDLEANELGVESLNDSKVNEVSFYTNNDFTDLCRGPHADSTGKVGHFKLIRVGGAYWRGNEKNAQMQRVYGVAFETKKELDEYLHNLEEAKKRDHRKLGQELDLFVSSDLVGSGLPLFTPRGTVLRNELVRYSEDLQRAGGFEAIWTPHIAKTDLYKKSGHYDKYPERFEATSVESGESFLIRPMSCPHAIQIYASRPRSYKDLPIRYMETTTMYRDEKSGELHGLSRVRSLTTDDGHEFVRIDQIEEEIASILNMVEKMYKTLDLPLSIDLSFRDSSEKYFGDKEIWARAEGIIKEVAENHKLDFKVVEGEAAFYGPKIDIHVRDSLGRKWQCATVQLDFIQPERFELEYTDSDGLKKRPVMIHKAILGSIERFLGVYIEHTSGKFPMWLAPEQLRVVTLNQSDELVNYAKNFVANATQRGLRVKLDNDNESVGKKIRSAEVQKVPYIVVIGMKEVENSILVPRIRTDLQNSDTQVSVSSEEFINKLVSEYESRTNKSTL